MNEMPAEWLSLTFRDICTVRQGLQISISDRQLEPGSSRLPYITIAHLNNPDKPVEYIENPKQSVVCREDDILMTRTGNTGIVVTGVSGVFHNNFFLVDYDRSRIDKNFLVNYLRLDDIQNEIITRAGTSTIPDLNHKDFYGIPIPVPPLAEQRKIADILTTWDRAIDLTTQLIAAKQQRKRGLMQQLLTGQRRFAEFDQVDKKDVASGSTPRDWSIAVIQEISLRVSRGKAPSYTDTSSSILAVNQKCVRNGRVDARFARFHSEERTFSPSEYLIDGDICINSTGTGTAGRVGLWNGLNDQKRYFVDTHVTLIRVDQSKVVPRYLCEFLNLPRIRTQIEAQCIFGGTNQVELSRTEFAEFQVLLPPLAEQRRIAAVLQTCDQEIALFEQKRDLLQQQKQGLMQQLLTGRVRVNVDPVAA